MHGWLNLQLKVRVNQITDSQDVLSIETPHRPELTDTLVPMTLGMGARLGPRFLR